MKILGRRSVTGAAAGCLLSMASQGQAAGFAIVEQGVTGLGNAYAGGAAVAEDASTIYFNPAGITRLKGTHVQAGAHIIVPSAEFTDRGSSVSGTNGGDAGVTGFVPNLYYVRDFRERLKIGLAVNAPFGLATEYDSDWVGRYHALDSSLATISISPALAYRVNDRLSVGATLNIQYATAELTNKVDFGLIAGVGSGLLDGMAEVEGNDWALGATLGMLYEFTDQTRVGINYRSTSDFTLEGDADFSAPAHPAAQAAAAATNLTDTSARADLTTPDSLSMSVYHSVNRAWSVMADVTWTNWNAFDELRIEFGSGAADSVVTMDWEDSLRYSVGASYRPNAAWTARVGVAYDETPIPSPQRRTPRIPGEDRTWLAFGFSYARSADLVFDVGYAHLFLDDPRVAKTATGEDLFRGALVGSYDASVDILSAQVRWRFD